MNIADLVLENAQLRTEVERLRLIMRSNAKMIRVWAPETFPADEKGQVHFARALMESVADELEEKPQPYFGSTHEPEPAKSGDIKVEDLSPEESEKCSKALKDLIDNAESIVVLPNPQAEEKAWTGAEL